MKRVLIFLAILGAHPLICAQVVPHEFKLGTVRVSADAKRIVIHADKNIDVDILEGGHTWPKLTLDEDGRIYVGATAIDPITGRLDSSTFLENLERTVQLLPSATRVMAVPKGYQIKQQGWSCTFSREQIGLNGNRGSFDALKFGGVVVGASNGRVLALSTRFDNAGDVAGYRVSRIDLRRCLIQQTSLARTDMFVELGATSRGGWWLTGSIEQSLLRSSDGTHWRPVTLPANIHGLVSSYVVDDMEIWLAASSDDYIDGDPELLFSDNGGKAWRTIRKNDPYLKRLPKGWIEGQRRAGFSALRVSSKSGLP